MVFIETPAFTRDVQELLADKSYAELQGELIRCPDLGTLIVGTGGLRKMRWAVEGRGKRGGARVVYYWQMSEARIFMLAIYAKAEREDLTAMQKAALKNIVEKWL